VRQKRKLSSPTSSLISSLAPIERSNLYTSIHCKFRVACSTGLHTSSAKHTEKEKSDTKTANINCVPNIKYLYYKIFIHMWCARTIHCHELAFQQHWHCNLEQIQPADQDKAQNLSSKKLF
jgi:hypothetical protein